MWKTLFLLPLLLACETATDKAPNVAPNIANAPISRCFNRNKGVAGLRLEYGEHLSFSYLMDNNTILEVFTNPQKKTWTVIHTFPNGVACPVASGNNFTSIRRGTAI